jgi:hypothetical protein
VHNGNVLYPKTEMGRDAVKLTASAAKKNKKNRKKPTPR